MFPFENFFIQGNKQTNNKSSRLGQDQVNRGGWGMGVDASFGQKLLTQHSVGRWALEITHHKMGRHTARVFKKKSLKQTQPLTLMPAGKLIQMGS